MIAGRLRTVGVPYALPRDTEEINRLDFQHYLLRYAFRGLYAAPIGSPSSVLDVGAGTGRWAREMAELFPQANIVGVDVMPPPADETAVTGGLDLRPINYTFVPGNVLESLPFPDAAFDFVHQRLLFLAIPADRWQFVIGELARVTRPGSWVESVESGSGSNCGPAAELLFSWGAQTLARRGIDLHFGPRIAGLFPQAGLTQVQTREIALPFGVHGGRVGSMLATDILNSVKSIGGFIVAAGVATQEQFEQTWAQASADAQTTQFQGTIPFYLTYGQRG
jgi:ubiquinone/menaquinone biosynthesis C-methylase UbiE